MTARVLAAAVLAGAALLPTSAASAHVCAGQVCLSTCGQKVCLDRVLGFECTPSFELICGVRDIVYRTR